MALERVCDSNYGNCMTVHMMYCPNKESTV